MVLVDAHCDTISRITELDTGLFENKCHNDLKRMHAIGGYVQFFAAFVDPARYRSLELRRALQLIDNLYQQAEKNRDLISICYNYDDIHNALQVQKIAALISIEGGEALQGELSALRAFYRLGVRSICLTWNYRNEIADGVKDSFSGGGLTKFGCEVISEMNRLGVLIDLSHISEKGFWDTVGLTSDPLIVSHSNAYTICNHPRNLNDTQIMAVKANGGVIGINLYPYFLNNSDDASIDDVIKHIEYIASLTGEDCIGLGADLDGIECTPRDINGVEELYKIFDRLTALNYSQHFIEKFSGGNFLRVIKQVLI